MPKATFEQVIALSQKCYDTIWDDWYSGLPEATKARLETTLSDYSAGYSPSEHRLLNPICEGNLDDFDIFDEQGWPIWRIQIVHEMLHEWQYKKPCIPSEEAVVLHAKYGRKFWGEGHGPDFFQAILEKCEYFKMSPVKFIEQI